jgi:hypothetical protein
VSELFGSVGDEAFPMRKYMPWIVIGLILAFTIGIEATKRKGALAGSIIFAGVVVFFVYIWARRK